MGAKAHKTFAAAVRAVGRVLLNEADMLEECRPVFVRRFGRDMLVEDMARFRNLFELAQAARARNAQRDYQKAIAADSGVVADLAATLFDAPPSVVKAARASRPAKALVAAGVKHPGVQAYQEHRTRPADFYAADRRTRDAVRELRGKHGHEALRIPNLQGKLADAGTFGNGDRGTVETIKRVVADRKGGLIIVRRAKEPLIGIEPERGQEEEVRAILQREGYVIVDVDKLEPDQFVEATAAPVEIRLPATGAMGERGPIVEAALPAKEAH